MLPWHRSVLNETGSYTNKKHLDYLYTLLKPRIINYNLLIEVKHE